jgi:signal transduction histidine kinase
VGIAVMLIAGLLAAWLLARISTWMIRRRIREIRSAAESGISGEPKQFGINPKDDFSKLRSSLGRLSDQLRITLEEQDHLRERLTRSEKLALLGELAAVVAHEVNNPLDGLQNCTRIIRRKTGDIEQLHELLDLMESGLNRIEMTVRRLLTLARDEPVHLAPARVDEMFEEALKFVEPRLARNAVQVVREFPAAPIEALADRWQFVQALINLFINAADAMPHGGRLTLAYRSGGSDATVQLDIADTGTGIPEEHRPHIFEPFYTTKSPPLTRPDERSGIGIGTGLGLQVVSRVVQAHNGRIELHSQVGQGTRFTIELPAVAQRGRVQVKMGEI